MVDIQWVRYPLTANIQSARNWLQLQVDLCFAPNTIDAYARALDDYFCFCKAADIEPAAAKKESIAAYVKDLRQRNHPRGPKGNKLGLASATIKQRLTIVRLYYDHLVEESICSRNPASRGSDFRQKRNHRGQRTRRDLVVCPTKLPWIPNDQEWKAILRALNEETLRNKLMFAFAYDGALRREEVCGIAIGDINPANFLLTVRADVSKSYFDRIVPFTKETGNLLFQYLKQRRQMGRLLGPLLLSESRRNKAKPISIWTWSKVIEGIADRANVPQFTTQLYIHLSGREVAQAVQQGMNAIHTWRITTIKEALQ